MNWLVIMAGGYGERFWPLSRRRCPKQLLALTSQRTMIQETVARLRPLFADARILVVTNRDQAAEVRRQLPGIKNIIAEPAARNTAPAIALAAAIVARRDPRGVMAVVPADGWIGDVPRYRRTLRDCLTLARQQDVLITLGIQPTSPHTGYGYIQTGQPLSRQFWKAKRFVEKPDRKTARRYLAAGDYRWNAGIFVWSVRAVQAAFREHQPALAAAAGRLQAVVDTPRFAPVLAREYRRLEKISVDYAVMEKAGNVVVANGDFPWDDVGDWLALGNHLSPDKSDNRVRGRFAGLDARGCVVVTTNDHLVAAVGIENLIIVHTPAATLLCQKSDTQRIKQLVQQLAADRKNRGLL